MMRWSWKVALFALVSFAAVPAAQADMLPVSATATADGSNFRYTYGIVLTTDSKLQSGDYFTVFDFPSPKASTAQMPAGWTLSLNPLGGNPHNTVPGDSATVPNLTWTYHGPTVTGQTALGSFSIETPDGTSANEPFSFTSLTQQSINNANVSNITSVTVPVGGANTQGGGGGTPPGVPEPSTLLLMGIGLPLAGLARRLRAKRIAVAI